MSEADPSYWDGEYDHVVCNVCHNSWHTCQTFRLKHVDCEGKHVDNQGIVVDKKNNIVKVESVDHTK